MRCNAARGSLNPYQMSSADFDVAFITPVLVYGAQYQSEQGGTRAAAVRARRTRSRPSCAR